MPINNALTPEGLNALGAAFGFYPQLRRNRTVQDPRAALDIPVQVVRGRVAATAGMPSDILNMLRTPMPMEMYGDTDYGPQTQVPYGSQELLKTLPLPPQGPAQQAAANLGALAPMTPAEALQAARLARQAALAGGKGAKAVGRMAGEELNAAMFGERPGTILGALTPQPKFMVSPENKNMLAYRGSHTAPGPDFGAPLHDLTGGGQMYPADVYSSRAAQVYGGGVPYDQKAFSIAQQFKDKPDAFVTIYRAVPKDLSNSEKLATLEKQMAAYMKRGTLPPNAATSDGSKWYDNAYEMREKLRKTPDEPTNDISKINPGDWVTLTREYAKDHGESALRGQYKILSQKVRAKDVWTNADSIHEFGYQPQTQKP